MPDRITVGDAEIISITDVTMQFPWSIFLPNIPFPEIEAYKDLYPQSFGNNMFKTDAGAYAVRSGGKTILVDTGLGPGPIAMLGGIEGHLTDDMHKKGVDPNDVDIVVHTHLHFDHVGWNMTAGKPTFPNATYYAPQADIEFFFANKNSNPQIETQVEPLQKLGKLESYSGEITLARNVTTLPTPGHTVGHSSVVVGSSGDYAVITGDVAHHPCQVDHPEWTPAFDDDGAAASATRKKLVDRLEKDQAIGCFCHFPNEFGRITTKGNRRIFRAL